MRPPLAIAFISALAGGSGGEGVTDPGDPPDPGVGTGVPSWAVGTWHYGSVSSVNFFNPNSGSWGTPSGEGMFYHFSADGKYEKGYMIQSTLYNCTMTVLFYSSGKITADGSQLSLRMTYGRMKS